METEIKFLNPQIISIEYTKQIVIELCNENNWLFTIQHTPTIYGKNLSYEFSIYKNQNVQDLLLHARIISESFFDSWSLNVGDQNPKEHFGENCYYLLHFIYVGGDGYDLSFMLEFSYKLVQKIPHTIIETLDYNSKTMFEEYNECELNKLWIQKEFKNWKNIKYI